MSTGPTTAAGLLDPVPASPGPPAGQPSAVFADAVRNGDLELPAPGRGRTRERWAALARLGRRDLSAARLAEGHADALAILAELGRTAHPGAYGVWASRAGGGAELWPEPGGFRLRGTVRFCSGAHLLDRALVVAGGPGGTRLVDVDLTDPRVERRDGTWRAPGMSGSDTDDVTLHDVPAGPHDVVGPPDAYTDRPGFWWGGAGVAAVWLGGAAGLVDDAAAALRDGSPDPHRAAGLAAVTASVAAADALLAATACAIDADPSHAHRDRVRTVRAAVERAGRDVLDQAPVIAGVAALAAAERMPGRLADLQVYLRQHHGGRDLADLGHDLLGAR